MSSFLEEPLNLSAADRFGYLPADIAQPLDGGRYTIVRKLGWGPRSSTWLAQEKFIPDATKPVYWAIQAFTVAKSREVEATLLPLLQKEVSQAGRDIDFPNFRGSFSEKSVHGEHLCLVMSAYGLPFFEVVQAAVDSGRAGLPVHVVQKTTSVILETLEALHAENVMHAGVKLENLKFWPSTYENDLQNHLAESPPPKTQIINGIPAVRSQPLANYKVEWDEPMSDVSRWMILLAGFGHGTCRDPLLHSKLTEIGLDYSSAPETLLGNPTCGLSTDIWMLGCLVFQLLTGKPLFTSAGTPAERLAEIRDILQDKIPDAWLRDTNVQALPNATTSTESLEHRLKQTLTETEASAAHSFLRKCLVLDPAGRASATELQDDGWVEEGAQCSCCYSDD
ncbi:kinase-like domain-containing protein [Ephemerocybe angulata]|uniref:Kinase-like domain-containing protein n=1 Tax=Ephemerocybe angulata TaxID=980116 RepID=A0A8H6I5R5_9AGAR|nr:kinase-like domain-containing protein [Tulosesus angulatus]